MQVEALIETVLTLAPASEKMTDVALPGVRTAPEGLVDLLLRLRDNADLSFDLLLTHTAVDRLEAGSFELLYVVTSTTHGHTLVVSTSVPRSNPIVPTASLVYRIAHWHEREVYDLFGVLYDGHTDLRRLFLEDDWQGHPLRRDYDDPFMLERPQ